MRRFAQIGILLCLLALAVCIVRERKRADVNNRAVALLSAGNAQAAADLLEQAVAQSPNDPLLHKNLGAAYDALEQPHQASVAYERSLDLEPAQPDVRKRFNELHESLGLEDRAQRRVERMRAQGWQDEPGVTLKDILAQAEAHIQMNKHREAITLLERALFREPHNLEIERMIERQEGMLESQPNTAASIANPGPNANATHGNGAS